MSRSDLDNITADLVDEYRALRRPSVLGEQGCVVLRCQGRRGPDRRKRLPRRTLSCSAELGGAGVPQAHSLQQTPQGRALCGLGTAEALFRRGSRGLQIAAVGFCQVFQWRVPIFSLPISTY